MDSRFQHRAGAVFFLLFILSAPLPSKSQQALSEPIHPKLGTVVDLLENAKYNIFGPIPGFSAGCAYIVGQYKVRLHLIRQDSNQAQILVVDLDIPEWITFKKSVEKRITDAEAGLRIPAQAALQIDGGSWAKIPTIQKVTLNDGNEMTGTFISAQRDTLVFKTLGGLSMAIPDAAIESLAGFEREFVDGKWMRVDPNSSRLFFAPTGRPLKAGTGYFADYYVFFPTIAVGVTDFLSFSGGMSLIPGLESQIFYFAPKFTYGFSPSLGLSAGFLTMKVPDEDGLMLGYAVTTFGNRMSDVTLGTGIPLNRDSERNLLLLAGAGIQVSNSVKLITENWIFIGEDTFILFSGGFRFFSDKLMVDLAFLTTKDVLDSEGFPLIPYVDFAVFFGK